MHTAERALGVSVAPLETRRDVIVHTATVADRLGYDAFFLPETWAYDGTVLLAELAIRTRRIRLGTGILNVWSRTPAVIAMAALTLHAVSGGRFVLGLGAGTARLTEGLHDVPFVAPLERVRRVVLQVRALLAGDHASLDRASAARPLRLGISEVPGLPIYLAGLTRASVALACELADGWLPFLFPRSRLGLGQRLLADGAGRWAPGPSLAVCPVIPTAVAEHAAEARLRAASSVAVHLTNMGEAPRRALTRLGFAAEVGAILAANPPRAVPVIPRGAETLLDELSIHGPPEIARARLRQWYDAGATMPVLLPSPGLTAEEIERTLCAFREEGEATAPPGRDRRCQQSPVNPPSA